MLSSSDVDTITCLHDSIMSTETETINFVSVIHVRNKIFHTSNIDIFGHRTNCVFNAVICAECNNCESNTLSFSLNTPTLACAKIVLITWRASPYTSYHCQITTYPIRFSHQPITCNIISSYCVSPSNYASLHHQLTILFTSTYVTVRTDTMADCARKRQIPIQLYI